MSKLLLLPVFFLVACGVDPAGLSKDSTVGADVLPVQTVAERSWLQCYDACNPAQSSYRIRYCAWQCDCEARGGGVATCTNTNPYIDIRETPPPPKGDDTPETVKQ